MVHYLINMVHFLLGNLGSKKPNAVMATLVDCSSAVRHLIVSVITGFGPFKLTSTYLLAL